MKESVTDLTGTFYHHLKQRAGSMPGQFLTTMDQDDEVSEQHNRLAAHYADYFRTYGGGGDTSFGGDPFHPDVMSLRHYTGDGSSGINTSLANIHLGGEPFADEHPHHEAIQRVFATAPRTPELIHCYSGMCPTRTGHVADYEKGHQVFFPAYTSTSIHPQQASHFAFMHSPKGLLFGGDAHNESHVIHFTVPEGSHAMYVMPVSHNKHERELLLNAGTRGTYNGRLVFRRTFDEGHSHRVIVHHIEVHP